MRLLLALGALSVAGIALAIGAQLPPSFDAGNFWPPLLGLQGAPPQHWSDLEKSLAPNACGQCHAEQLAQWQTSR